MQGFGLVIGKHVWSRKNDYRLVLSNLAASIFFALRWTLLMEVSIYT